MQRAEVGEADGAKRVIEALGLIVVVVVAASPVHARADLLVQTSWPCLATNSIVVVVIQRFATYKFCS